MCLGGATRHGRIGARGSTLHKKEKKRRKAAEVSLKMVIWSATPPSHRVIAAAVIHRPPTLYTGESDGSLIWCNLHSDSTSVTSSSISQCHHWVSETEKRDSLSNGELESSSSELISNSIHLQRIGGVCVYAWLCLMHVLTSESRLC